MGRIIRRRKRKRQMRGSRGEYEGDPE